MVIELKSSFNLRSSFSILAAVHWVLLTLVHRFHSPKASWSYASVAQRPVRSLFCDSSKSHPATNPNQRQPKTLLALTSFEQDGVVDKTVRGARAG
jgi:hypothetical protein